MAIGKQVFMYNEYNLTQYLAFKDQNKMNSKFANRGYRMPNNIDSKQLLDMPLEGVIGNGLPKVTVSYRQSISSFPNQHKNRNHPKRLMS